MSKHSISLLAVVFLIAVTGGADAGLIGTRVLGHAGFGFCPQCNAWNDSNLDPTLVSATVVDPGVEFFTSPENGDYFLGLRLNADFSDTTLAISLQSLRNFLVVNFDLEFTHLHGIADVNVLSNTFNGSSFSFTDDSITVHLPEGFPTPRGKKLLLGVTTVPEGGTSALFLGLSLAALWTLRGGFATRLT